MTLWIAVYTHAHSEEKASFHLRRQGYNVFLPKYLRLRRHARRVDWVPKALFPRYLFVSISRKQTAWRTILSTIGVSNLICADGFPVAVPGGVIDEIKSRQDENGFVSTGSRDLKKGDKVRFVDGPLQEVEAIFDCADDIERVTLLSKMMGHWVKIRVRKEKVFSAS